MDDIDLLSRWNSFVAIGDSFTEGMSDPNTADTTGSDMMIGWADRFAQELSQRRINAGLDPLMYANLAIRGRKVDRIYSEQIQPALDMKPDLMSIVAGGNDFLRVGANVDAVAEKVEDMVRRARGIGADVLLINSFDAKDSPILSLTRPVAGIFNCHLFTIAQRYDCFLVNQWGLRSLRHVEAWADDHLHLTTLGHTIMADAVLDTLGLEPVHANYATHIPPDAQRYFTLPQTLTWMRDHVAPWVARHARGRSSGDGRPPKYPELFPVVP